MISLRRLAFTLPLLSLSLWGSALARPATGTLVGDAANSAPELPNPGSPQDGQLSPGDTASNDALWERAQKMYAGNDFAQASAAAARVTSPSLRKSAQAMISGIQAYVADLQDGVAAEARHDPKAAIAAYTAAARIKSDGPGDPGTRAIRVKAQAEATEQTKQELAQAESAKDAAQKHTRAAQLLKKGLAEEAAGDERGALSSLQAAQVADPANTAVSTALTRLRSTLTTPNIAEEPSPAVAIRDFYSGLYAKAEEELSTVVASPNAKARGASFFYLGAAHYYRSVLENGLSPVQAAQQQEVSTAFRQAHALGYVPRSQFVSPELMHRWQAGLVSSHCE